MNTRLPENEQALFELKMHGSQPITAIADKLGVTVEGARFHLIKLEKEGLVESRSVSSGRGRPKQIWSITEAGNTRFPDTHANLSAGLINIMRETLGDGAVDKVIEKHEDKMLARYKVEIDESLPIEDKISKLTEIRSREGYMAEYRKEGENFLFIENHCPICAAARVCQGFCRAELNIFQKVLGENVHVERIQHIIKGERRCAYLFKMLEHSLS